MRFSALETKVTNHYSEGLQTYFYGVRQQLIVRSYLWRGVFNLSILVAFFYVFMEWLFFVTMPSFMSLMSLFKKVEILLLSGLGFSLFCLAVFGVFVLIDLLGSIAHLSKVTGYCGLILPSITLSVLALLLVDNFTYTVFKFGISTSVGIFRGVYALFFVLLTGFVYYYLVRYFFFRGTTSLKRQTVNRWFYASLGLLVISAGLAFANLNFDTIIQGGTSSKLSEASDLPNILLLGSDGLNAENLSVYGYYRDTTPRLNELAENSLVAENAFTNSAKSTGSVISIMTSKLPTQTRVLYPPDILTGIDSFQHLPGILKNLGYKTVEYGVPYYIDAFSFNLQNGFDVVNNRTVKVGKFGELGQKLGFDNEVYFLTRLIRRVSDRILHIFFIRTMQNPYAIVTQRIPNLDDATKIKQALSLFNQSQSPLFIHIHLLGTHGGYYSPKVRMFSKGERQDKPWMTDFYDDTLLGFDAYVGEVIDQLKAEGAYENTILIIYTDHNKEFKVDKRIPLIIHFPGGEHARQISMNVQNLDIAPTILDYLGISKPNWMEGESLLKADPPGQRLIFSTGTTAIKPNEHDVENLDPQAIKPPFYQFSYLDVIDCQNWYSFDLTTYEWSTGGVAGYVKPCSPETLLSKDQIKQAVYQRLSMDGFDTSSLP